MGPQYLKTLSGLLPNNYGSMGKAIEFEVVVANYGSVVTNDVGVDFIVLNQYDATDNNPDYPVFNSYKEITSIESGGNATVTFEWIPTLSDNYVVWVETVLDADQNVNNNVMKKDVTIAGSAFQDDMSSSSSGWVQWTMESPVLTPGGDPEDWGWSGNGGYRNTA